MYVETSPTVNTLSIHQFFEYFLILFGAPCMQYINTLMVGVFFSVLKFKVAIKCSYELLDERDEHVE